MWLPVCFRDFSPGVETWRGVGNMEYDLGQCMISCGVAMKKQDFINFIGSWPVIHRNETDLAIVRLFSLETGRWEMKVRKSWNQTLLSKYAL